MKKLTLIFVIISFFCKAQIKQGIWRGVLVLNTEKQLELPFNFEIKKVKENYQLILHNAEERIVVDEISFNKDSFNFKMPIFDTEFKTKLSGDSVLSGLWINHTQKQNNTIAFNAKHGVAKRFIFPAEKNKSFYNGKWEVTFSPGKADSSKAIGLFKRTVNSSITEGTFLTETGDYRYMEGVESNGKLYLSSFDGSHGFLFIAEHNGTEITKGDFYAGTTWHESWIGKRNETFELKDPETLTYLKNPDEKINFSFYNTKNEKISLNDEKYKNKVVIIQIMGSWCPNCMDESVFLSGIYKQYNKKGLEIIGLAYERTTDNEVAKKNIIRLTKRLGIGYDILITGLTGKEKASESLPFLNKVIAFPTTIVLDRKHKVKSIYTGFNGPATGKAYVDYSAKTEQLLFRLLSEK